MAERPLPRLDLLRQLSDEVVFEALVHDGAATRAELAARTGISKPTAAQAIRRLELAGVVAESGVRSGRRGGVGTVYDVAADAGVVLAVVMDQAGITVRSLDLAGRVLGELSRPPAADRRSVRAALRAGVREAAARPVLAVGVSVANPVQPASGRVVSLPGTPFPEGDVQPVEALRDLVAGPIVVDNDVNLTAVAERQGAGAGLDSFAVLYVGAGLGAALCLGDAVVSGAHGLAGELGFLPAEGMTIARLLAAGAAPALDVPAALRLLDSAPSARRSKLLDRLVDAAARAVVAIVAVADPARILLTGPVGAHAALVEPLRTAVAARWPAPVEIVPGSAGPTAALDGAGLVALAAARRSVLAAVSG